MYIVDFRVHEGIQASESKHSHPHFNLGQPGCRRGNIKTRGNKRKESVQLRILQAISKPLTFTVSIITRLWGQLEKTEMGGERRLWVNLCL